MINFTQFAPDLDVLEPGVIANCTNLVPTLRGYEGAPSAADSGMAALAATAVSGAMVVQLDASIRLFVGTDTKLYEKTQLTWTDVSRVAAYGASSSFPWRFAQFGNTTLAVCKADVIQASSSGAFADLTAPKAATMCVASGFVMIGNTNEGTYGDSADRWWCSEYLVHTGWTPAISTQCTTGRLTDTPGPITGLKTMGYDIVVYKAQSMYLGRYVGPPGVWDFTLLPGEAGCSTQEAVVDIGTAHIFIGQDDIYMFQGSLPVSIGTPLREWFFGDLDGSYKFKITSSHDRVNALVYFYYPRIGGSGALNGCIVYNYKTNKWGLAHRTISCTIDYVLGGYTWDTLPLTTWDSWPNVEYDSPFWVASTRYASFVGTDKLIYSLTGASATSSLTTGSYGDDNIYSLISRVTVRYLTIPTTASMTNYYQDVHGGAWTTGETVTESSGRFDVLRSAPWHRVKFDWTGSVEVSAADADVTPDGVL